MLEISKESNPNYLAKIIKLDNLRKHSNADRLQIATIDFQTVVTGLDAKEGDIYVYFPVECTINKEFLSFTNSYREKGLNKDKEKTGFFEKHGRVKAIKLRGEKSMGYIVPLTQIILFLDTTIFTDDYVEDILEKEFDTILGTKMLEKYIPKNSNQEGSGKTKKDKVKLISRTIDNQINLHVDTLNLRKNIHKLSLNDNISISYKTHGTSWWCGNILVKKTLSWIEKILIFFGVKINTLKYGYIYGSRRTIKNGALNTGYYKEDLWGDIKNTLVGKIPKGFTLYGECVGYTKGGKMIQKDYDYNCMFGEFKTEVYRITHTNKDGLVTELNSIQRKEFCKRFGLNSSLITFEGTVAECLKGWNIDYYSENNDWKTDFLKELEKVYNEKDCIMCINKVPEEGIVLRVENLFECNSYKLKSFRFLEKESKDL